MSCTRPFVCVLLCVIGKNLVAAGVCDGKSNADVVDRVLLKLYRGNSSHLNFIESTLADPKDIGGKLSKDKDTVLYAPGFMERTNEENVQVIIRTYQDERDVNLIVVDWSELSVDINYPYVASQVVPVGKAVAESIQKFAGLIDFKRLHLVGHSLGAHLVGAIGRNMNVTITRITGLDPAFPLFYPSTCRLHPTDAEIVVALHTDGGLYGTPVDTGSLDFYANKGIGIQPGCYQVFGGALCSHQRSIGLYSESIKNPKAFPSHPCHGNKVNKKEDRVVYFGDKTPKHIHGAYCFNTNSDSPYGKGPSNS